MAVLFVTALGAITFATATPPAGSPISNQATATYTDDGNNQRTTSSNTVTTYVAQVAGFTVDASQNKNAAPGTQVYYPQTLTNTGNGTDTFLLSATNTAGFALTGMTLYADANGDGVPDNSTPITTTGPLGAGGVYKFVVVGTVPPGQTQGATSTIVVSGSSTLTPSFVGTTATDITTVQTASAIVNVTKAFSTTSGTAGSGPYTITFTYTNTGNVSAGKLIITDTLNASFVYQANTSTWSVTGASVLAENSLTASGSNSITTAFAAGVASYTVASVAPGESRSISFNVKVASNALAGIVPNTAAVQYDPTGGTTPVPEGTTNTANFTVTPTAAVLLTGTSVASANQGATIPFNNVVTNNGNATDTFQISYTNTSFPAGSTFQLFKSDGVTPLTSTVVGSSIPDTGPLAPGASYTVVMKVVLPIGVSSGTPFSLNKTATSVNDPTKQSTGTDTLTTLVPNTVDLTNNTSILTSGSSSPGYGPGTTTTIVTGSANPGATTRFTLWVNNTSPVSDTYDITTSVPAGWTVVFKDVNGAVITNTGVVQSGTSSKEVFAYVTSPVGQAPGTQTFDFRVTSPTSGATDVIRDAVVTNTVRSIAVTPNNTGQDYPGGTVYYSQTITNNGNVTEGGVTASSITLAPTDSQAGWSSVVYYDINGTGVIAGNDPILTGTGSTVAIAPGASIKILVKVTAPPGAADGSTDTTTITATANAGSSGVAAPAPAVATDTTTIVTGDLILTKSQALDVTGTTAVGSLTFTTANLTGTPGTYIRYKIVAANQGTGASNNVVINDQTPSFTTFSNLAPPTLVTTGTSTPILTGTLANGATGPLQFSFGTLNPGQSATATFEVKINQ